MAYWRMQLHPNDRERAMMHTVQSLGAGFIGLAYGKDPGDLTVLPSAPLPEGVTAFDVGFATRMEVGDRVLIIVHNFPFALATVDGDYNYVRVPHPELRIWCNRFRRVRDVKYYADRVKKPKNWKEINTYAAVQWLTSDDSVSYDLIETWP